MTTERRLYRKAGRTLWNLLPSVLTEFSVGSLESYRNLPASELSLKLICFRTKLEIYLFQNQAWNLSCFHPLAGLLDSLTRWICTRLNLKPSMIILWIHSKWSSMHYENSTVMGQMLFKSTFKVKHNILLENILKQYILKILSSKIPWKYYWNYFFKTILRKWFFLNFYHFSLVRTFARITVLHSDL